MGSSAPDLDAVLDSVIREHQQRRYAAAAGGGGGGDGDDEDLLDVLLRLQKDVDGQYPLTTLNIKSVIMDLFAAGSETSATALQRAMILLVRHPVAMGKAQAEVRAAFAGRGTATEDGLAGLRYLRLVVKEALWLYPPAPLLLPRECRRARQVLGHHVPRGAAVLVNAWAIGRDPAHWDTPEEDVPGHGVRRGARRAWARRPASFPLLANPKSEPIRRDSIERLGARSESKRAP